ncbi:sensor histidine kinase [Hymenobacter daeguensis]
MPFRLRSCWLGLSLLLLAGAAAAQSGPVGARPFPFDSLRATVRKAGLPDTERVFRAMEAYQALIYARPDSAPPYVAEALALARRIGFTRGQANAYGALAGLEYQAHRYARAQHYYQLMLRAAQQAHHTGLIGSAYAGMASMAVNTGNAPAGLRYYAQARATFAQARPRNYNNEVLTLYNLSNYHLNHQQPATAAPLVRQAVALLPHCTWPELPVAVAIGLGQIQHHQHQPDSAVASWQRAVRLGRAAHLNQLVAEAHSHLGGQYLARHRPAQALAEARQALSLAHQSQAAEIEAENLALLAEAMRALGQPAAYDTLHRLLALRDTLHAHENAGALSQAQARFTDAEQQAQIRSLQQERRLAAQTQELTRLRYRQQVAGVSSLAGGLLLLAGWAFWQYRRRQQQRQATHDTALRTQLAADLHDDVGALLTQISLQSDLLRETTAAPAQTLARLERLSDTSRRAARQMADVVWGLHASSADLPEVLVHMRDHAHEVLPPAGLSIDFDVTPEAATRRPSVAVCQTIYLIYKEALHNVVKHARTATQVTIRLRLEAGQLCLSVRDNAPGPAPIARSGSHGLANMRHRAEAVGGTLHFAAEATGFGVVACLPG